MFHKHHTGFKVKTQKVKFGTKGAVFAKSQTSGQRFELNCEPHQVWATLCGDHDPEALVDEAGACRAWISIGIITEWFLRDCAILIEALEETVRSHRL